MALNISEFCIACDACRQVCPNDAICEDRPWYMIDADKCTECSGEHAEAQCASICPVEGAICDELGVPLNPPGSLTGIPPEVLLSLAATGGGSATTGRGS